MTRSSKRLPDQRQPITSTILRHLICQLKSDQHLRKPDRAMLSAAFCLAFYGLLRVSEYTAPSDKAFISRVHATLSDIQWHSQHFTFVLKQSKTDQQGRGTMISFCKLTKSTCLYHSMATYIALAPPKDPHTTPLFCFSNGRPLTRFRLLKHLRHQLQRAGYHPHRLTHTASELVVQLQWQRLAPHKQQFSSWADGVARHTGVTSAHHKKHHPCTSLRQQRAAPQPQAQTQEPTAGHMAGGSTNEMHAPQQDRNTGSRSQAHTQFISRSAYYDTGWF